MKSSKVDLVRYVSPFGSPAWMPREQAARLLAVDDRQWLKFQSAGVLDVMVSAEALAQGPPRIERVPS